MDFLDFIRGGDPDAALNAGLAIQSAVDNLAAHPLVGRRVTAGGATPRDPAPARIWISALTSGYEMPLLLAPATSWGDYTWEPVTCPVAPTVNTTRAMIRPRTRNAIPGVDMTTSFNVQRAPRVR